MLSLRMVSDPHSGGSKDSAFTEKAAVIARSAAKKILRGMIAQSVTPFYDCMIFCRPLAAKEAGQILFSWNDPLLGGFVVVSKACAWRLNFLHSINWIVIADAGSDEAEVVQTCRLVSQQTQC